MSNYIDLDGGWVVFKRGNENLPKRNFRVSHIPNRQRVLGIREPLSVEAGFILHTIFEEASLVNFTLSLLPIVSMVSSGDSKIDRGLLNELFGMTPQFQISAGRGFRIVDGFDGLEDEVYFSIDSRGIRYREGLSGVVRRDWNFEYQSGVIDVNDQRGGRASLVSRYAVYPGVDFARTNLPVVERDIRDAIVRRGVNYEVLREITGMQPHMRLVNSPSDQPFGVIP